MPDKEPSEKDPGSLTTGEALQQWISHRRVVLELDADGLLLFERGAFPGEPIDGADAGGNRGIYGLVEVILYFVCGAGA